MKHFKEIFARALFGGFCVSAFGDAVAPGNPAAQVQPAKALESSRELYNAGTKKLFDNKFTEAESLLQSALAKQDEKVQAVALYNLGHLRMAQGREELKKAPSGSGSLKRGKSAGEAGDEAIEQGEAALAGTDMNRIVAAYIAGRGARKELRAATKAVQLALEAHGKTLLKWRRSLGDFQSALELRPDDLDAAKNAETMERAIAKLVDSLREMQKMGMKMGGCQSKLGDVLSQLKGRIPKENMPPGAPGDDDDDPQPESMSGMKEAPSDGGKQMEKPMSPEEAGNFLEGIQPDGKLLPMGQGDLGKPRTRPMRTW